MGLTQITTGGVDENINIDSNTLKVDGTNNRVGIGTASPTTKLEINGGTDNNIVRIVSTDANANIEFADNTTTSGCQIGANGDNLKFGISGTEQMRIDSSGRVAIGQSTANDKLHVAGNIRAAHDAGGRLVLEDSNQADGSTPFYLFASTGGVLTFTSANRNGTGGTTGSTERLRIDSSGNVGIGTTSPKEVVDARGAAVFSGDHATSQNAYGTAHGIMLSSTNNLASIKAVSNGSNDVAIRFIPLSSGSGSEAMRIDSSGRLLINTSSEIDSSTATGSVHMVAVGGGKIYMMRDSNSVAAGSDLGMLRFYSNDGGEEESVRIEAEADAAHSAGDKPGRLVFRTTASGSNSPTERMRIDSSGNVGIGTTSPQQRQHLHIDSTAACVTQYTNSVTGSTANDGLLVGLDSTEDGLFWMKESQNLTFGTANSERMRITSSGNMGIGEVSPLGKLHVKTADSGATAVGASADEFVIEGSGHAGMTIISGTDQQCIINFADPADANVGGITYSHSDNSMVFRTSDGERMRLDSTQVLVGRSTDGDTPGLTFRQDGFLRCNRAGNTVAVFNRRTNDGTIIQFRQGDTQEGTISVSGNTVTYGGGHLARWSQLAGGAERIEILRGSVLSNLDEMCEWGEEDNEVLNRMKVSDVEGDSNVSGVFQCWDDDDDVYTNDFYCAMTGDFVIRIAQETTVARGDLLMSAGDGTAKPQDDDIVRSKTIAKVTSTTVSTTYSDGSYCVPCVLMAC